MAAEKKAQIADLQQRVAAARAKHEPTTALSDVGSRKEHGGQLALKARRILKGHFGKIYACHWAEDSRKLVSASQDGKLIIWNAFTTNKVAAIPLRSSWVMTCAYAPSGRFVACGGLDNLCTVYKAEEGAASAGQIKPAAELSHHEGYLSCCRFVSDDKMITSSGDATCLLWDIQTRSVLHTFSGHGGDVMSVSAAADGSTFVSGSVDATAKLWDARQKNSLVNNFLGHESDINSVDYRDSAGVFATGSDDSTCRLFDLRSQVQQAVLANDKILSGITSVALSMTARFLFAGYDDHKVVAWDVLTAAANQNLEVAHDNRVSCLGVTKNGQALATGSWDSLLKVWA